METDRLKYFCAIAESRSLTKAASLLGVSHSGLSKAMSVLQQELGAQLLKPCGRGLEVTERGKEVYNRSKLILASLNDLRVSPAKSASLIKIGIPEIFAHTLAGPIAKACNDVIEIIEMDVGDLERQILQTKVTFGFTFIPFPHKHLEHLKIAGVSFASFVRRGCFSKVNANRIPYVVPSSELSDNPLSLKIKDGWNIKLDLYP